MSQQMIVVDSMEELLEKASLFKIRKMRLIQICCTAGRGFELTYSFDSGEGMINLRYTILKSMALESIGDIYPCAFLYENELADLFGIQINNMAVDFRGNLYQTAVKTPFNPPPEAENENGK